MLSGADHCKHSILKPSTISKYKQITAVIMIRFKCMEVQGDGKSNILLFFVAH